MTYEEALEFISRQGRFAMKLGTERTRALLDRIGAPDRGLRGALIAGTNGKGSTGACLASILRAAGRRVGFMPKPHLISYTERIEVDGQPISEADFAAELEALMPTFDAVAATIGPATEFEMLTVLALAYLATRIDDLVCEVGLGGRLDATNALDLGLAIITNVDLDHQKYLGNTIGEIAREKAAIIKQDNRVVTGCGAEALAIVEDRAALMSARLWRLGLELQVESTSLGWDGHRLAVTGPGFAHRDLRLPLVGDYQPENAALAVAAAHLLGVGEERAVREGLAATRWPGRLQVVGERPRVILDGGHNPAAMVKAGAALRRLIGKERLVAVFAMLTERDPQVVLAALRTVSPDAVVFTEPASAHGHAVAPEQLAGVWGLGAEVARPAPAAVERARELAGPTG
ncbi:MAG TPA: cyanophycin synthetase, partial [Candidatus Dormibacteraeota bacterium]|nr:cyanophycin synthetase [Candidatus Dormibacteraeota bacterium]